MTFDWDVWGTPLGVLIVGVGGGLLAAVWSRRAGEVAAVVAEGRRADLLAQHDAIVRAVRELELERDKLAPEVYADQRAVLLSQGAAALRALDGAAPAGAAPAVAPPELSGTFRSALEAERQRLGEDRFAKALGTAGFGPAVPPPVLGMSAEWKGAMYALGVVALLGALAYSASEQSAPRTAGGSMTGGSAPSQEAPVDPQAEAQKKALEDRLAKDPRDINALDQLTEIALSERDGPNAKLYNDKALAIDPTDVDARIQHAALMSSVNMDDAALELLDQVLTEHPDNAMAQLYKGMIALGAGKKDIAAEALQKAIDLGVDGPMIRQALAEAKGEAPPAGPMGGPMDGGDQGSAPPGEAVVSGTITLDPAATDAAAKGAVLYVSARDPAGGPPLLAKKLPVGPFPMDFTLTTADRPPMGGPRPLPAAFDLTVRIDFDGNAMSKDPGEPIATMPGISAGANGLAMNLKVP